MEHHEDAKTKDYVDLTEILNKERSERDRVKVDEICAANTPVAEKIRLIEEIDRNSNSGPIENVTEIMIDDEDSKLLEEKDNDEFEIKRGFVSAKKAEANRNNIKKAIKRTNLFVFWFSELSKISAFAYHAAKKNELLIVKYFPPSLRLNRRLTAVWNENVYLPAVGLESFLMKVLENDWRSLSKKDYNMLAQFRNLCYKITSANIKVVSENGSEAITKIRQLEKSFLTCYFRSQYRGKIIELVRLAAGKYPESKYDTNSLVTFAKVILEKSFVKPSLANIILAMNMVKYRKCVGFRDLILENDVDIISDFEFECTPDVKSKINDYIKKSENDLIRCIEEKKDLERYENFLPLDSEGLFDYSILEFYYNKTKLNDKAVFKADFEMVPFFMLNCARVFKFNFYEFLSRKVSFTDNSAFQIFDENFLSTEFENLESQSERLKKYHYEFKNLTPDRIKNIINKVKPGTNTEMEMYGIIKEITRLFREIAVKLVTIINAHYSEVKKDEIHPITSSHLSKRSISIAGYDMFVSSRKNINKMRVDNILKEIIKYCFLAAFSLDSKGMTNPALKKEQLENEIEGCMRDLERMAPPEQFVSLRKKLKRD